MRSAHRPVMDNDHDDSTYWLIVIGVLVIIVALSFFWR